MLKRTLLGLILLALTSLPAAAQSPQARQFLQAPQYSTGANSTPQAFAVADFNNDGIPDVAVADSGTNAVSIFLGNGDGTFTAKKCGTTAMTCPTGNNPQGIASGDFNQDGNMDLAVTNFTDGTITVLFGNGSGGFSVQSTAPVTGRNPRGIAVTDFNADGYPDIVVTNAADGTMGIFLNNGHGGFAAQATYITGFNPWAVAVGDLNGDGNQDVVIADNNNNNVISLYLGNGTGGFGTQIQASTGPLGQGSPVSVAVGYFNGLGTNLDVAVAVQGDAGGQDMISVLVGNGKGGFAAPVTYATAPFPVSVATADLNGDGDVDLAVAAANGNVVTVFWGNGDGTFSGEENCGTGDIPSAVAIAQLTKSGQNDLIVANSQGNSFSAIINNGNKTFQSRLDYVAGTNSFSVVAADFNGDGISDLAFADKAGSEISVTLGNGDGTFQAPQYFSTGTATQPTFMIEGDFNNDGVPDIAVANYATSTVSVFLGQRGPNKTFTFPSRTDYSVGNPNQINPNAEPTSIVIGDFNGDNYPDLAVTNFNENSVSILLNQGIANPGAFTPAPDCSPSQNACPVGAGPIDVGVGKFDGNQTLDLVVINESANNATVLLGNGDGTFTAEPTPTAVGGNPLSVAVADLNGDGIPDLAVADFQTQQVSVLLGNGSNGVGNGTFQTATPYLTGTNPSAVVIGDFNGDGIPDLALTSAPSGGNPGNQVSLLWGVANGEGKPSGTFSAPALFGAGYLSYSLAIGDFNSDGAEDLAVANSGSNTVSILLNLQGTNIDFTPTPTQTTYGQSLTLSATVTPSVSNGAAPTGTLTFENGNTMIGAPQTLSNGHASLSTSTLAAGTDSLVAVYSGDGNYQAHTVPLSQKVSAATSSTSLSSSSNPSAPDQAATFTASVTSPTAQPAGAVNFLNGSTVVGTGILNGSGQATFSTSTLALGTYSITAVYAGNSNITGSTSSVLQQVIAVPALNFSLTANTLTPGSIAAGAMATATVTITPAGGLDPSSVKLTCAVSPSSTPAANCLLGSITVAKGVGTATLTFQTAGPTAALMPAGGTHGSNMLFAVGLMIPALLLGGAGFTKPGRKRFMSFCLFLALAGCMAHMGCGGSSATTPPPSGNSGTPAGAYQVMVSGSASGINNSIAKPLSVTVR